MLDTHSTPLKYLPDPKYVLLKSLLASIHLTKCHLIFTKLSGARRPSGWHLQWWPFVHARERWIYEQLTGALNMVQSLHYITTTLQHQQRSAVFSGIDHRKQDKKTCH